MRIATRREVHDGVERLLMARVVPGVGPLYWTSCYRTGGVLVDSGHAGARGELARFLDERPVEAALATHEHEDHVGNFRLLEDRGVPTFAPQATVDLLRRIAEGQSGRLPAYRAITWGNHDGARGVRAAQGRVLADGRTFRLVPTPGHQEQHVAILDESSGALFAGDAVLGKLRASRRVEDVPIWMDSLRAIRDLDPRVIYPAHGSVLERPRAQVEDVLTHLEGLQRRAHALAARGWTSRRIARDLLGKEGVMTWFSGGEFSKVNLVRSLLSRPPA